LGGGSREDDHGMSFLRPTLEALAQRVQNDFVRHLALKTPILRRSMVGVLSRVVAGAVHGLHGHLVWASKQMFPDVSDVDFLERQAAMYGIGRKAAAFAAGPIRFTGTNGTAIPLGTVIQRADGQQYRTTAAGSISSGTATIQAVAVTAGAAGNAAANDAVALVSPITGVATAALVGTGGLTNGADAESTESLRARVLSRLREPPLGGAEGDYVNWALAVPGITRAWVYPLELGPGTVTVRVVNDDAVSIIPNSTKIDEVAAYIEERRPVTASVTVVAPVAVDLDFTIELTPDTTAVRAAVEAELRDLLRRDAAPGGPILLSRIREAVSVAAGESDNSVTAPSANVTHTTGQIAVMGEITWT
jgi:uncharacterized phage protein gp47/JayE